MLNKATFNLPPGSNGAPLIGEIREWLADPLLFAQQRAAVYGSVWRTHLLGRPTVVLLEPEGNQWILSTGQQHFSWREGWGRSMLRLMGGGLSLTDGAEHDARRRALRPAFSHATLMQHVPTIQTMIAEQCAQWAQQKTIVAVHALRNLAFDIALAVICGSVPSPIAQELHRSFDAFTAGLFTPLPWPIPGTPYYRAKRAGKRLRAALGQLLSQRRLQLDSTAHDALSLILQHLELEPDAIISELLLLLWAGHDTVASLLTWVLYELEQHPEYINRIQHEAMAVIGSGDPQPEHMRQLPELDRVLRECERLHPPAPGGFRGVIEPFTYGGYHIPAGWLAMYSTVYTHMQPDLWRNPDQFNPDRFSEPQNEGRIPYSLIGFGGGPRICIGLALAQIEMRLIVLELTQKYQWKALPEQSYQPLWLPTNQPKDGSIIQITTR